MFRFRSSAAVRIASLFLVVLAVIFVVGGCSIISFDHLTVSVWPSERNAVLSAGASPWVEFPNSADQASVQRLFTLSAEGGAVPGDFRWAGLRMYFDPAPSLQPGVRYVLQFRGRVTLENGQSFDADEEVPFYVGHSGTGSVLASVDPADGAMVGIVRPLVLSFSTPVDGHSFALEFDLQPAGETQTTWDVSGQVVTITPRDDWTNLTTYTWKVGKNVSAADGTPLGIDYSGRFRVQQDSTAPTVVSVVPALRDTFAPTGNDLDHTGADDALQINLSEDVRTDSLNAAFTLTPSTKGTLVRTAPGVFAFTPESRLVMAQSYTLRIGPTVEDLSGNKLSAAYEAAFTPFIPVQQVLSVEAIYAASSDTWTVFNTLAARPITVGVDGSLTLAITFQEPFTVPSEAHLLSGIIFDGYFPASVADPSLVTVAWSGGLTLTLTYSGLQRSDPGLGRYYKLALPGGAASSDNGSGSFLKEDVWLYFLANQ